MYIISSLKLGNMQRGKRIMNLISQYKGLRKENSVLCFGRFVTAMGAVVRPMLTVLFEPDKDQIPQIMERIFLQYYKLYNKSNSVNFIPKYDYIPMAKGNGIKEDKTGED